MTDVDIEEHMAQIEWGRQQGNGEVLLSPSWEVFILGVSILSVFNLVVVWLPRNPDIDMIFIIMDAVLTVFFVADLVRRLVVADDVRRYLGEGAGWVDAVATFPILRILRILRIVRAIRVMRRLGGPAGSLRIFFSNKAAGGLLMVVFTALLVLEFGALAVLGVERGAVGANIETAQDAIWYVLVTMSTVGYGDFYPVTELGRMVGALIILVGVGVFGTLTGFLANAFLAPSEVAVVAAPSGAADSDLDSSEIESVEAFSSDV